MDKEFNPERLQIARKYNGFTVDELSKKIGLSAGLLMDFENGVREPTLENVTQMYWVLKFPIEFFYQKDNFDIGGGPIFMCDMKNGHKSKGPEQTKLF